MRNKYYFVSDIHLGINGKLSSKERELLFVEWLDWVKDDAKVIYLVGDIWDFYFEYKYVVPKGSIRLLGKLAELVDLGIEMHFFKGNHDMWMFDYLSDELNIPIHNDKIKVNIEGKKFLIGHGDGLGPGDKGYKRLKKLFRSRWAQFLFKWIHPDIGMGIAHYWSSKSRHTGGEKDAIYHGENEWLLQYCHQYMERETVDYFIFGHRHLPIDVKVNTARYINLGEWIQYQSYAVFDGEKLELKFYKNTESQVFGEAN